MSTDFTFRVLATLIGWIGLACLWGMAFNIRAQRYARPCDIWTGFVIAALMSGAAVLMTGIAWL